MSRYCYIGRDLKPTDNPRIAALDYRIRILPDGSAYADTKAGARRLDTMKTHIGLCIATLSGCEILLRRDGVVLVGDEIARGVKDAPEGVKA